MDEVNQKAIERMGDILDAIKVEIDEMNQSSNTFAEDKDASETILNLTYAFDELYRRVTGKGEF